MNKKRYWLRGGIIGVLYFVLVLILAHVFGNDRVSQGWFLYIADFPAAVLAHFGVRPTLSLFQYYDSNEYITVIIANFIIGAALGWLYGKIKNRKSSVSPSNI